MWLFLFKGAFHYAVYSEYSCWRIYNSLRHTKHIRWRGSIPEGDWTIERQISFVNSWAEKLSLWNKNKKKTKHCVLCFSDHSNCRRPLQSEKSQIFDGFVLNNETELQRAILTGSDTCVLPLNSQELRAECPHTRHICAAPVSSWSHQSCDHARERPHVEVTSSREPIGP